MGQSLTLPQTYIAQPKPSGHRHDTVLIDGSVLANAPFVQAIEALKNRPAKREVDRRFVYIDPRPDLDVAKSDRALQRLQAAQEAEDENLPGFFSTIFGAISNIPREQPIRDNLDDISRRSNRIIQMRQITDNLRGEVEQNVEAIFGRTLFLDKPTAARLATWRRKSRDKASKLAGFLIAPMATLNSQLYLKISPIPSGGRRPMPMSTTIRLCAKHCGRNCVNAALRISPKKAALVHPSWLLISSGNMIWAIASAVYGFWRGVLPKIWIAPIPMITR